MANFLDAASKIMLGFQQAKMMDEQRKAEQQQAALQNQYYQSQIDEQNRTMNVLPFIGQYLQKEQIATPGQNVPTTNASWQDRSKTQFQNVSEPTITEQINPEQAKLYSNYPAKYFPQLVSWASTQERVKGQKEIAADKEKNKMAIAQLGDITKNKALDNAFALGLGNLNMRGNELTLKQAQFKELVNNNQWDKVMDMYNVAYKNAGFAQNEAKMKAQQVTQNLKNQLSVIDTKSKVINAMIMGGATVDPAAVANMFSEIPAATDISATNTQSGGNQIDSLNNLFTNMKEAFAQSSNQGYGNMNNLKSPSLPPQIAKMAEAAANEFGVNPLIYQRLIMQESGGNPNAISSAGATGLAQLMPGTAQGLGVDINNPSMNIRGGAKHLKQLLETFNGDYVKALAAYNAGAGAVQKYGGIPPFAETQNYVKSILGNVGGSGGGKNTEEKVYSDESITTFVNNLKGVNDLSSLIKIEQSANSMQTKLTPDQRQSVYNAITQKKKELSNTKQTSNMPTPNNSFASSAWKAYQSPLNPTMWMTKKMGQAAGYLSTTKPATAIGGFLKKAAKKIINY